MNDFPPAEVLAKASWLRGHLSWSQTPSAQPRLALWYQRMVAVGEPHSHETAMRQENRRGRRKTGPVPITNLAEAPDDDQPPLAPGRGHDSARSSTQSTYSRRSENSHAPSVFTNVSL
jgi:hypothetical protein